MHILSAFVVDESFLLRIANALCQFYIYSCKHYFPSVFYSYLYIMCLCCEGIQFRRLDCFLILYSMLIQDVSHIYCICSPSAKLKNIELRHPYIAQFTPVAYGCAMPKSYLNYFRKHRVNTTDDNLKSKYFSIFKRVSRSSLAWMGSWGRSVKPGFIFVDGFGWEIIYFFYVRFPWNLVAFDLDQMIIFTSFNFFYIGIGPDSVVNAKIHE